MTEAAARGDTRPVPLGAWLCSASPSAETLESIAYQIVQQVHTLGAPNPNIQALQWDEIKADRGTFDSARKEAIQIAATAVRYLLDVCGDEIPF